MKNGKAPKTIYNHLQNNYKSIQETSKQLPKTANNNYITKFKHIHICFWNIKQSTIKTKTPRCWDFVWPSEKPFWDARPGCPDHSIEATTHHGSRARLHVHTHTSVLNKAGMTKLVWLFVTLLFWQVYLPYISINSFVMCCFVLFYSPCICFRLLFCLFALYRLLCSFCGSICYVCHCFYEFNLYVSLLCMTVWSTYDHLWCLLWIVLCSLLGSVHIMPSCECGHFVTRSPLGFGVVLPARAFSLWRLVFCCCCSKPKEKKPGMLNKANNLCDRMQGLQYTSSSTEWYFKTGHLAILGDSQRASLTAISNSCMSTPQRNAEGMRLKFIKKHPNKISMM